MQVVVVQACLQDRLHAQVIITRQVQVEEVLLQVYQPDHLLVRAIIIRQVLEVEVRQVV